MSGSIHGFPNDVGSAAIRTEFLERLAGFDSTAMLEARLAALAGGAVTQSGYVEQTPLNPRLFWGRVGTDTYIFISGITTAVQGQGIFDGYKGSRIQFSRDGLNSWYVGAKEEYRKKFVAVGGATNVVYITGHSAGGAIAWYLAWFASQFWSGSPAVYITTFGAPHSFSRFSAWQANQLAVTRYASWNLFDDIVARLPPSFGYWDLWLSGLSYDQIVYLGSWLSQGEGILLDATFRTTPGWVVSGVPPDSVTNVATYLRNADTDLTSNHRIASYAAKFKAASLLYAPANAIRPALHNVPREDAPRPAEIRRFFAESNAAIFNDATRQNLQQVSIPDAAEFQAIKGNGIWTVNLLGKEIAIAPKKKRALALARMGNDFLRRLQNEAVVWNEQLAAQLTAYLVMAADPTGGFTPKMNTKI